MHQNSLLLFEKYAKRIVASAAHVLEIGPDRFPSTLEQRCRGLGEWHTIDITRRDAAQTFVNEEDDRFPIDSDQYDVVVAANVLEHVKRPWAWMGECVRVLRPGGHLILVTPVSWPFHPAPVDCWRVYPDGMTALLEDAGCDVLTSLFASEEAALHAIANPVPGIGLDFHLVRGREREPYTIRLHLRRFLKRRLASRGFPTQCAYDTVGIGVKRPSTAREATRGTSEL